METQREKLDVRVRWMIRGDMIQVLDIERESFEFPWSEDDFMGTLRLRNCVGMVAETDDRRVAGFMIYELHQHSMQLLSFAVASNFRRTGVGAVMLAKLKGKIEQQRREAISALVRERNLPAQLFFRSQGFQVIGTHRNYYEDSAEDAYEFVFEVGG